MLNEDYKMQAEIFAENLNKYMAQRGMNQDDLAVLMNVSNASAHYWMEGIKIPRMNKIQTLADYFGVELSDLVGKTQKAQPKITRDNLKFALFGGNATDKQLDEPVCNC